eukprot:9438530-Pyramimonas_sp.AAC.1
MCIRDSTSCPRAISGAALGATHRARTISTGGARFGGERLVHDERVAGLQRGQGGVGEVGHQQATTTSSCCSKPPDAPEHEREA